METKILQLAVNNLMDEVEKLKIELLTLKGELELLRKTNQFACSPEYSQSEVKADELMNIKEVQSKLGICYNSLNKLVKQGILKPIRINQRRIRFSKLSIIRYIEAAS